MTHPHPPPWPPNRPVARQPRPYWTDEALENEFGQQTRRASLTAHTIEGDAA